MSALHDLFVWDDRRVASRLAWYRAVADNEQPAKFRIAATIPVALDLDHADEAALWNELDRVTPSFLASLDAIRERTGTLASAAPHPHLIDLCRALAHRMLAHCNFCAWNCRVDRAAGTKFGTCKLADESRVSSFFHHPGEELVFRGRHGSGTIFFTSCNMRCAFCQNGDISTDKDNGSDTDARTLAAMAWLLRMEGCHNVNWVGGEVTIHLHTILDAIGFLADGGVPSRAELRRALPVKADPFLLKTQPELATYEGAFNAPMLWNSNFFMSPEAMRLLRLVIDVWLPDFKFGPGRCAITLARTPRYWDTVTANLALIHGWGEDLTVRHLVMPDHVECCTYPVLDWLAAHMPDVPVNIMDQYHPDNFCDPSGAKYDPRYVALARRPSAAEIDAAYGYAAARGLPYETVTFERARSRLFH
jgi:putative pyruvate formate lyase activating enzyme